MPAPYTDTEQDDLIDQLIADVAALTARVDTLETGLATAQATVATLEGTVADLQAAVGTISNDVDTANANIGTLQTTVGDHDTALNDLDSRVSSLETVTIPAVDTVQEDVKTLAVASRRRQETDVSELGKSSVIIRPSIERVRRPDGRYVQRVARPR